MPLDGLAIGGTAVWLVAAALYLSQTVRRVTGTHVVIGDFCGRIGVRATRGAVGAFGARFDIPRPLAGLEVAVLLPPGSAATPDTDAAASLDAALRRLTVFRVLSTLVFALAFIGLPLLADVLGLTRALLVALPVVYLLNLAQAVLVVRRRRVLGLERRAAWGIVSDIMLCPPYGASLAVRLAAQWQASSEGVALGLALAPRDTLREVVVPMLEEDRLEPTTRAAWLALVPPGETAVHHAG